MVEYFNWEFEVNSFYNEFWLTIVFITDKTDITDYDLTS